MIREQLLQLLDKPVTRREFLGYIGLLILTFIGVSAMFRSISEITGHPGSPKKSLQSLIASQPVKNGYGNSRYGV